MSASAAESLSFPHAELLADISCEWNAAEESIKRSEQIVLDVSIPAVSELRYAGRRIIDALDIARRNGPVEEVRAVLEDARFCCHRARHDAVDAALSKIAIDLDDLIRRLGYAAVIAAYPEFQSLYAEFAAAREKVAMSRSDRQNRNAIYQTVATVDFPSLAKRYVDLTVCKPIALSHAARRRAERIGWWTALAVALATMIFAALAVDWSKFLR